MTGVGSRPEAAPARAVPCRGRPLGRVLSDEIRRTTPRCEDVPVPQDHFGEKVAAVYDESSTAMFAPEVIGPTVDLLAELAGDGAALEFAIGTGRVAAPLG